MTKLKVLTIVGLTASGKTELAVKLAKKYIGEIINADSRQIYKGMSIGTAKPKGKWIKTGKQKSFIYKGIRHHLIDFLEPNKGFNVAKYKKLAIKTIKSVTSRNKLPILVGGTGLYLKAVIDNLIIPQIPPQPKLRQQLEKQLKQKGLGWLYGKLIRLDPGAYSIIDPHNPRRVIRALEITLISKKPFSTQRKKGKELFNSLQIGINISPKQLKKRINKRAKLMLKAGLLKEIKSLIKKYGSDQKAFDAIGYREIINYLNSAITLKKAIELIKKNTQAYARRQSTWFKKDKRIHWVKTIKEAEKLTNNFLDKKL